MDQNEQERMLNAIDARTINTLIATRAINDHVLGKMVPAIDSTQQYLKDIYGYTLFGLIATLFIEGILLFGVGRKEHYDRLEGLERKLNAVQSITVKEEVPVPVIPDPTRSNVVGGPQPDVYFVTGTDDQGKESRAYLSIDGRLVEEYFK